MAKQTIIVQAIVKKAQRILLLQKSAASPSQGALYELPGGIVNFGETPQEALVRHLQQQLGHPTQVSQLLDVTSSIGEDQQIISLLFLAGLGKPKEKFVLDQPRVHYEWMELSKILPLQLDETTKIAFRSKELQKGFSVTERKNPEIVVTGTSNSHPKEVIVYTDGGSRGNPGPSAAGFVILNSEEEVLFEGGKYLGITTNNQAEYQAVKLGLEKAAELGARVVKFRMDSLLIVNQMLGVYQIKNKDLWPIYASIKELIKKLDEVTFTHVRREFNQEADALVNKVLNEHR